MLDDVVDGIIDRLKEYVVGAVGRYLEWIDLAVEGRRREGWGRAGVGIDGHGHWTVVRPRSVAD